MNNYSDYFKLLNWHKTVEEQKIAIDYLTQCNDWNFKGCIINTSKDFWENVIKIISNKNRDNQVQMIYEMMYLLKDLNWPGALEALKILKTFNKYEITNDLEKSLSEAYRIKDTVWIANLKLLIEYYKFNDTDFKCINLTEILDIAEW